MEKLSEEQIKEINKLAPNEWQTPCTTLREFLVQKLNSVNDILNIPNLVRMEVVRHFAIRDTLEDVIKMIDERLPVA